MTKPKTRDESRAAELLAQIRELTEAGDRAIGAFEAELAEARAELARAKDGERNEHAAAVANLNDQGTELRALREQRNDFADQLARADLEKREAEAAAAAANKRRALLLCAARASCKRLRAEGKDWRGAFEAAATIAGGFRSRLAAALARANATERLYQRAEDQRAAAESALETLEGQATLAEERVQAVTNELAEGLAALSFARTVHARQRRWIVWGKLRRERDRHAVRRLRQERGDLRAELGELTRERDQVRAHLGAAVDEHTEEAAARIVRELAAATEHPDHCSNDHAFSGAFRALSPQACSGAGDQPCTGEQSSPEPAGESSDDFASGWIAGAVVEGIARAVLAHYLPAQPARPIRAGREDRGAGRFPRGGGRPGIERLSAGAVKGKVGIMGQVAKAGPSPADRESAVNQGERARLVNPECTAGALTAEPEPEAGGSSGWFGTTGAGERVDPGGALRVAVAVLGAVDLLWWLAVRLLYLCGRRADEEPGRPGARYLGIGWHQVDGVKGGALCEAWIGYVPPTAEPRDGWPVGWEWQACPLEPPGWHLNPELDDRAFQEPGAIGVLVFGKSGRAELGACVTAWGDRWTAPGFDAARLVRLLRAEITDAELRAEERDDTEDYSDDEDDPDALADQEDARIAAIAVLVAYADEIRQRGRVGLEGAPPHGLSDCMHRALAGLTPREREILRQRCPGIPPLFADQRPEDLPDAHEESAPEPVADERPPATCRTGQEPADSRVADLPVLREGYRWEALTDSSAQVMTSAEIGRGSCVAELYPINSSEGVAGWFWSVAAWSGHDGESDVSPTRQEAAGNVARVLRRATTGEG